MSENNCLFCKIISGQAAGELLHQDEEIVVFKDIKPAAKYHYLAVPKKHINNVKSLILLEHKILLEKLIEVGKTVLAKNGGSVQDVRLGFHCPPFNSISHLHLHIISPASEMSFISRMIFKPNSWWFQTAEDVARSIAEKNKL